MEPEQIITALLAVLGSSVAIEIIPIKINPWTWLARRIGKAILGDVTEQLSGISEQLKSHIEEDARDKAKRLRVRILRFADELLQGEVALASVEKRIKNRVKVQMERNQREYYLSEQLKAINKEMGREDDPQAEVDELEKKLEGRNMPQEARERCQSELRKLRSMLAPAP